MTANNRKFGRADFLVDIAQSATVTDRSYRPWPLALFALFLHAAPVAAEVAPLASQTISLPTAPGSIDGLGESFEPQLNTGSYIFRIPLKLPPVRGKVQPEVSMTYNSGGGNGPLGLGWTLRVPYIQRQTDKGLPNYLETDGFITGDGEELVKRDDGSYRREVESDFTRWTYVNIGDFWEAKRRDGSMLVYGSSAASRLGPNASQVFRWMLESAVDPNGNRVEYLYTKDAGQIYLSEVRFGLHEVEPTEFFRLSFSYDDERPDKLADYRGRFRRETRLRLRSATLFLGERRVRHWQFDYDDRRSLTQLGRFTAFGDERTVTDEAAQQNEDYLPPIEFDYSQARLDQGGDVEWFTPEPAHNLSLADPNHRIVDLNSDGLPDVLLYFNGRYYFVRNNGSQEWTSGAFDDASTFYPPLGDASVKIADLSGNGRSAVLYGQGSQPYYREFIDERTLGPPVAFNLPLQFSILDPAVRPVDITNSRALDFMKRSGSAFHFIINRPGDGANVFYAAPESAASQQVGGTPWQIIDMNGDRMPDVVILATREAGGVRVFAGKGGGDFEPASSIAGGPGLPDLVSRGVNGLTLADLDGDGLPELVLVDFRLVRIWRNLSGTAWADPIEISGPDVPEFYAGSTTVTFQDMNGNGSTDIVWNDPARGIFLKYLELHPASKPNLLVEMRNGMGRRLELEYRTSTDYWLEAEAAGDPWTAIPPFPIPVVSAFTEYDGMGSTYRTEVTYRNGYYDGKEREFRGFEEAVQIEVGNDSQGAPSLVTEFEFDTGASVEALKGQVLSSEVRTTGGQVFYRSETDWTVRPLPGGPAVGESRGAAFPVKNAEVTTVIEGGNGDPVTLRKEMEWDDFGNVLVSRDYGRVEGENPGAWEDERIVRTTYTAGSASGQANWILNLPVTETIEDLAGVVKSETRSFYDDPAFGGGNAGVVSKGNLTLVRKAINPGADSFISAQRMQYDAFGNPTEILDPLGTAPGAPHSRSITYDSQIHTHPVSETVHLGGAVASVSMNAAYDVGLGVMTSSSDFNGHETRYGFDPFGRIAKLIKPGDSDSAPTESYDYRLGMPISGGRTINWIETRARENADGGTVDSRMFFDGLTRKIMRRAEGEEPGQIVVTDTVVFNDRRTEWKTYLPYFETGTLDFADPTFETPFQEKHYDALGRVLRLYQPDTGEGRPFAETVYEPLARLQRDEEQTKPGSPHFGAGFRYIEDGLRDKDGKGRLRVVEEIVKVDAVGESADTPQTWTTRYTYDVLDNFEGYLDSQNNAKTFLYDGLSRKVFMDDPDRGHYWWAYDDAGNVIRTCDAKNQHLVYAFDGANRVVSEWHLEAGEGGASPEPGEIWADPPAAPDSTPDVAYHYDESAGPLARESFWRPREAEGVVKLVLEEAPVPAAVDGNQDGKIDVRDVVLRAAAPATGPLVEGQNLLGRLAWVKDQSGEEHLSYDARGRAIWKVKKLQAPGDPEPLSFFVENRFDSMDRLTRHIYADGTYVDYGYNARGLLETVGGAFTEVNYNPAGQNLTIALANGVTSQWQYDNRLRLERLTSTRLTDGLVLQDREYGYDEVSNITGITDHRSLAHRTAILSELQPTAPLSAADLDDSNTFTYDSLYRMTLAAGPAHGSHEYRFDPIGNLLRQEYSGDPRFAPPVSGTMRFGERGYGPHVLTGIDEAGGVSELSYDSNGNMTSDGTGAVHEWDPKDRLSAASEGGVEHLHTYDYASKRSIHSVTKGGSTRHTYYIDDVSEFREGRLVKYVYVGSEKVARANFSRSEGGAVSIDQFYLHDHLGSTLVAMDIEGDVEQVSSHSPYGHNRFHAVGGKRSIDYGFSGKELHEDSNLFYFETRFLSSVLARFTQTDSLTLGPPEDWRLSPQKWHSYSYTWGNPVTLVDKDGRFAKWFGGAQITEVVPNGLFGAELSCGVNAPGAIAEVFTGVTFEGSSGSSRLTSTSGLRVDTVGLGKFEKSFVFEKNLNEAGSGMSGSSSFGGDRVGVVVGGGTDGLVTSLSFNQKFGPKSQGGEASGSVTCTWNRNETAIVGACSVSGTVSGKSRLPNMPACSLGISAGAGATFKVTIPHTPKTRLEGISAPSRP